MRAPLAMLRTTAPKPFSACQQSVGNLQRLTNITNFSGRYMPVQGL